MLNIGQCIKEKMLKQERRQETNGISIWSYNIANISPKYKTNDRYIYGNVNYDNLNIQ